MFKIGDFSRLSRVSVRMLRYYDENDIFKPDKVDRFTGYRYYSAYRIFELNTIIKLRDYGMNVLEIGRYMAADKEEQKQMLTEKRKEAADNILAEKARYEAISFAIEYIEKEHKEMEFKVNIKSVPSMKMIALRDIIPSYDMEGILWERLGKYIGENKIPVTGYSFATYYDDESKEQDTDVEVLMEVEALGKDEGQITYRNTEAIEKAASILIPGDFSNIGYGFEFLAKWLEEGKHEIAGRMREVPLKGPWNEENPENYLTEIQCPIK